MLKNDGYLFYEAGQAVAAVHLGLAIRHISANPARRASEIAIPRDHPKARLILWLTGMAAEKRGVGKSDPLRRTRNRQRIRAQIDSLVAAMDSSPARRVARARALASQSQDRANAICNNLFDAIERTVAQLRLAELLPGETVEQIVRRVRAQRLAAGHPPLLQEPDSDAALGDLVPMAS